MKRLALVSVMCLPLVANAGWVEVRSDAGVPSDVTVTDGGVVVLATSTQASAWRVTDAGVSLVTSVALPSVGAGFFGSDCLAAVRPDRSLVYSSPACGVASAVGGSGTNARRFRMTPTLSAAVTFSVFSTLWLGPGADGPWTPLGNYSSPTVGDSLQVARVGLADVAVMPVNGLRVAVVIDGGAFSNVAAGLDLRDVAPLSHPAGLALLGVAVDGGLSLSLSAATPTFQPVEAPAGVAARFVTVAGQRGLASSAGGAVLSPLPDPSRPGEVWVARPGAPPLDGRVHCVDGRWCAGFAGDVAWALHNAAAPTLDVPSAPSTFGQPLRLVADAGDPDGDPVFVSWTAGLGSLTPVAGVADGTQVDLVPTCVAAVSVDVTATDGLLTTTTQVSVPVERRGAPSLSGPASVLAGGDAGRFEVTIDGGCLTPTVAWSTPTGQGGAATTLDWVPPATACAAPGTPATVTATVTWPGGLGTTVATADTLVLPWGAPEAPVFPSPAQQRSGTTVTWSPLGRSHACEDAGAFPGTELLWELDGGALAMPVDGGLQVTTPSACVGSTARFVARRQVRGEAAGRVSAPGTLVIDVTPDLDPLDASAALTLSAAGDGGVLAGTLGLAATCLAERSVEAEVTVSLGGQPLAAGRFPVPGPWSLTVPGACAGGQFEVTAVLLEGGRDTGARTTTQVTTDLVPVAIGAQSPSRLEVTCGGGAAGLVTLEPVPGACASADYAWRITGGPAVEVSAGAGDSAQLQTSARDWSSAGQVLTIEWSADAGSGNAARAIREVSLGVSPFLVTAARLEPVLVQEESVFRARVVLSNPSACAVEGLEVELPFSGATPVPDTLRLGDARVASSLVGSALRVASLSVPAGGAVELSVLARPRLLGRPSVSAVATLNGQLVSASEGPPAPAAGCGCASVPGSAVLALLAFVRWRRRAGQVGSRAVGRPGP